MSGDEDDSLILNPELATPCSKEQNLLHGTELADKEDVRPALSL